MHTTTFTHSYGWKHMACEESPINQALVKMSCPIQLMWPIFTLRTGSGSQDGWLFRPFRASPGLGWFLLCEGWKKKKCWKATKANSQAKFMTLVISLSYGEPSGRGPPDPPFERLRCFYIFKVFVMINSNNKVSLLRETKTRLLHCCIYNEGELFNERTSNNPICFVGKATIY